jgi:hypothetical protein
MKYGFVLVLAAALAACSGSSQQQTGGNQGLNHAPTITHIATMDGQAYVGQPISITLGANDIDGDKLTASWSSTCGNFDDSTSFTPVWTAPSAAGDCTLSVDVSDGHGADSHAQGSLVVHVSALWTAQTDLYPDNSTTGSYVTWNADSSVTLTKIDPATAANIAITGEAVSPHLASLSFDLVSGHCGGGAPRFYVTFQGDPTYYVYSCEYAQVSGATHSFLAADAFNGSLQNPPANGVISAIEIVSDVVGTTTISNIKVNGTVVSTPPCLGRSCTTLTPKAFAVDCDPKTWACVPTASGASSTVDADGLHLSKDADTATDAYSAGADILGIAGAPFMSATFDTTGVVSGGSPRFVLKYGSTDCMLDNPTRTGNTYAFTAASTYFPCVTDANLTGLEIVADGMGNAQTITLTDITVNGSRVIAP